jgi:Flp pilus assembly protein TadG
LAASAYGLARALRRDTQATAAVEFGLIAPLLMMMLLGTVEAARAINTDRHFSSAVATAGDLVAREEYLGKTSSEATTNLDNMMLSIKHLMAPYDVATLKLGVYSVRSSSTSASDTKVIWRYAYNGMTVPAACSAFSLPANFLGKNMSVIVVDAKYEFKPLFGSVVPGFGTMTWTDKSYHSPRNLCVDYVQGDNCKSC